ncbi:fasciclin domain-containing protein [Gramella sp. GC03-9]|uniref:Fasciclin domain-containing protein n=1 Tax=Christiangramia oceanisediminis TaxID=2920386 RepID=A0A9X2L001_9FLAO|nr:fasciclin domain-containing protein [Gramella oceanisediminis]MCP9201405.1 fasciclin domain-containing protein [Gramella oceanisediminis]
MKFKYLITVFALAAISFTSCEDNKKKEQEEKERMEQMEAEKQAEMEAQAERERMEMESNSIAAKATATDTLSTLVTALKAANMADLLKVSEGPYTVFAPNNAAFNKVGEEKVNNLLRPENQEQLSTILEYHVVEDQVTSQALVQKIQENNGEFVISTLEGTNITARVVDGKVVLTDEAGNKATVVQTDVNASNGVVHIIDGVLMKKG